MKLAYSAEHEALRRELRDYYDKLLTPELREEIGRSEGVGPTVRKIVRKMGDDGWLGIGWPKDSTSAPAESLGMTLVEVLTRQLKGRFEILQGGGGTGARLTFDNPHPSRKRPFPA